MAATSVLFAGVGGQGIVLGSKILAHTAFAAGCAVKESELHGMAQRGGSVVSHVRFGDEVHSPLIPMGKADFLVVLEELEGLRYTCYLKPLATVILNTKRIIPSTVIPGATPYPEDAKEKLTALGFKVHEINAEEIAKGLGNPKGENIVLIGALSYHLTLPHQIWEDIIRGSVPQKTIELNLTAFNKGKAHAAAAA